MSDNKDIEWKLHKGERYLIEIEPKEDIDVMDKNSIIESIMGDAVDDVNVVKLWVIGSNEMFNTLMDRIDLFADELKQTARNIFSEYEG